MQESEHGHPLCLSACISVPCLDDPCVITQSHPLLVIMCLFSPKIYVVSSATVSALHVRVRGKDIIRWNYTRLASVGRHEASDEKAELPFLY